MAFKSLQRIMLGFIGLSFCLIIGIWIFLGVVLTKTYHGVNSYCTGKNTPECIGKVVGDVKNQIE